MNNMINNTDFTSASDFAEEVRKAFKESIPPIRISIDTFENVDPFISLFQSERGFMGKRVSCKHAKTGTFRNYSVNEIVGFSEEQFPIQLSFKQISELEDFALGWKRYIEKANVPVGEKHETPPQEVKNQPDKGSYSSSVRFENRADIQDFVKTVEEDHSLEGIAVDPEEESFYCKIPPEMPYKARYNARRIIFNVPCTLYFESIDEVKSFAAAAKTILKGEAEKQADKQEEKIRVEREIKTESEKESDGSLNNNILSSNGQYPVDPRAEKILNVVASICLAAGWVIGIALAIFGLEEAINWEEAIHLLFIPAGAIIVLIT